MKRQVVRLIDRPGRHQLSVPMTQEGEEVEVLMLLVMVADCESELEVLVRHASARTYGRVMIRGLVGGKARVKVGGTIVIDRGCPGVNDFLEMRFLLLGSEAVAQVEPRLEIESADVRASHAAAVSRVSEEEIFYLNSRGIGKKEARMMLIEGFLREVVEMVEDGKIKKEVVKRLKNYEYLGD